MDQNKSLSTEEVANILHVSKSTIYALIKKGEIVSYKIGRKVRFTQEDVDAYIARSRHSQQVAAPVQKVTVQSSLLYGDSVQKQPLIISGQDVILDILSNYLHQYGIQALRAYVGSFESLLSLYQGNVQVATCHLWDSDTDSYNLPYIRRLMPGVHAVVVNLTWRVQGFYVKKGNPKNITSWKDLTRPDVSILNRRNGTGSRILLDEHLFQMGVSADAVNGYKNVMSSHLTVASAIEEGQADVGIGTGRIIKQFSDLDFIPVQRERYDLVIKKEMYHSPEIQALLQILRSREYQNDIFSIADNDYTDLGKIVGEV